MTTNFYGPGVAISYSLLAVLYLVLLILEIAFLLFKFYQNKPNWFKKKKQNTTFSSSFSSSESSSSGGGGGGTLVFVDNKSSSTTTFADSLPFYLLLLPATFGRFIYLVLCIIPKPSSYLLQPLEYPLPHLFPDLISLLFYLTFLSLAVFWAKLYFKTRILIANNGNNKATLLRTRRINLYMNLAFVFVFVISIFFISLMNLIATFTDTYMLYIGAVYLFFFPFFGFFTSFGFLLFGVSILRQISQITVEYTQKRFAQLLKVGALTVLCTIGYSIRALAVMILIGFYALKKISYSDFIYINVVFYVVLEFGISAIALVSFTLFNLASSSSSSSSSSSAPRSPSLLVPGGGPNMSSGGKPARYYKTLADEDDDTNAILGDASSNNTRFQQQQQ